MAGKRTPRSASEQPAQGRSGKARPKEKAAGPAPASRVRSSFAHMDTLQELLALMESHHLSEVEIRQPDFHIRLCRGSSNTTAAFPAPSQPGTAPVQLPHAAPRAGERPPEPPGTVPIKSPMVGTFYMSSSPDADPYVNVGDHVTEETVVCIIEAMKVMNEIKAEIEGEIVSFLVENGEPVEFGQPLMLLRPAGARGS